MQSIKKYSTFYFFSERTYWERQKIIKQVLYSYDLLHPTDGELSSDYTCNITK